MPIHVPQFSVFGAFCPPKLGPS